MLNEIIEKISSESGLNTDEVKRKIDDKRTELSELISHEGAAYIIAKELGVEIKRNIEKLNIENIVPGMQNVEITGKIIRLMPVREFKTDKASGRVMNMIIADKTGTARISLWNNEIDKISEISEGSTINVKGFVKEDNLGGAEIRLGRFGHISKSSEKIEIPNIERKYNRIKIKDMAEGGNGEIRSAIVNMFESNPFFEICPECGTRVKEEDEKYKCETHGEIKPKYLMVLSGIIDDGTENIRAVFFRENAEKIIGMSVDEAKKLFDSKKKISAVTDNVKLGHEYIFEGYVKRNAFFDRLEFIVNNVKSVDVINEVEMIMNG